jgi:2-amino-4-hydroxy-6-hydroxymethyldihydropteridine diphosphokinase
MPQERIFLMLGSNQGNRDEYLSEAKRLLISQLGSLEKESKRYETASWGDASQPSFLNQVLIMQTPHSPYEALHICQSIELHLGRERVAGNRNAGRSIDIDILYYGEALLEDTMLSLPHPRIPERKFVLIPLNETAPDAIHPRLKKTHKILLEECQDPLEVIIHQG